MNIGILEAVQVLTMSNKNPLPWPTMAEHRVETVPESFGTVQATDIQYA